MTVIEFALTILYNLLPIIIIAIPYFFIRKRFTGKLYYRILMGIIVFYLIYWVLPIIFQINEPPLELTGGSFGLGIGYIAAHFGSLIAFFASYPLVTLPFIFFLAPLISFVMVWNHVRKQDGSIKSKLDSLTFQLNQSPFESIKKGLMKSDWTREKDILKLLIVLLPISLYLLQVILSVAGYETVSLTTGETTLGWFLEILFVYLTTFIFSIEILFSSQIALKGRQFGETIRTQTFKSLYTVGAPISILSIILFIAQYLESLLIIIYFFAYFIMASVIFILFLKFFEPISILIFVKLVNWWKNRKKQSKISNNRNLIYILTYTLFAVVGYLILYWISFFGYTSAFPNGSDIITSAKFNQSQSLLYAFGFDMINIYNFLTLTVLPLIISILTIFYGFKKLSNKTMGYIAFFAIVLPFSIVLPLFGVLGLVSFGTDFYWITGQTSFTTVFGFSFFTLRSAGLNATLVETDLLGYLSLPYIFTRYIFNIIIWSLLIYYIGKSFKTKTLPKDENKLERMIFSNVDELMHFDDYIEGEIPYLVAQSSDFNTDDLLTERDEIKEIMNMLETEKLLSEITPPEENEKKRFYFTLKYLYNNGFIEIFRPEFSYETEVVEKQGLYIIYDDGRGIFNYSFSEEFDQDPGLISGMFSAITSFIKETTRSQDLLKTIDHGDIRILLEYGNRVFGALFIKGKQSTVVRSQLREFVTSFEKKYADVLKDWSGALIHFKDDNKLVERLFKEE
jgi:hypothetical protein